MKSNRKSLWCLLFALLCCHFEVVRCTQVDDFKRIVKEMAVTTTHLQGASQDHSSLLHVEPKKGTQFSFEQFLDLLELYYTPDDSHHYTRSLEFNNLIGIIKCNFYYGHIGSVSFEEANARRARGIKYPYFNAQVLSHIPLNPEIFKYFGFDGCLQLFKACFNQLEHGFFKYKSSTSILEKLNSAICSLQEFLKFTLYNVMPPFPLNRSDPRYSVERERAHEVSYLKKVEGTIEVSNILRLNAVEIIKIVVTRYSRWFPDESLFKFSSIVKNHEREMYPKPLRTLISFLVATGGVEAFSSVRLMQMRYSNLSTVCLSGIDFKNDPNAKSFVCARFYIRMCPILRALMLVDSEAQVSEYLMAFAVVAQPCLLSTDPLGPLLRVFDRMILDSRFLTKAKRNPALACRVLAAIEQIMGWNRQEMLIAAVQRGFVHVTEAFMMFSNFSDPTFYIHLVRTAYSNLRTTDSIEILVLVVAYSLKLSPVDLLLIAENTALFLHPIDNEFWSSPNRILEYDLNVLARHLLKQMAAVLICFPWVPTSFRSYVARVPGERIPFPCPTELLDNLFPRLYEYKPKKNKSGVMELTQSEHLSYNLCPHYSLLNYAQLVLFRMFGILFASSRFDEDGMDTPEWREVIGYLNFTIERHASFNGITEPLVQFFDPIYDDLKALDLSPEEYVEQYRQASQNYYMPPASDQSQPFEIIDSSFKNDAEGDPEFAELLDGFVVVDSHFN